MFQGFQKMTCLLKIEAGQTSSLMLTASIPPPSIAEQIRLLFAHEDIATWSLRHLGLPAEWRDVNEPGNDVRCQEAVNQVFTLTRADLETHLAKQGILPEKLPHYETTPGSRDGWYFIAGKGEWQFYYQERGFANFGISVADLSEARKLLINHFLPIWLEHLWIPCLTKSGKSITIL